MKRINMCLSIAIILLLWTPHHESFGYFNKNFVQVQPQRGRQLSYIPNCDVPGSPPVNKIYTTSDLLNLFEESQTPLLQSFFNDGAEGMQTLKENVKAFSRYRLRPRILNDVSNTVMSRRVLRQRMSFPVGLAPAAFQKLIHSEGEVATAKAALEADTIMILSSFATSSIEDVSRAAPGLNLWIQVYTSKQRDRIEQIIKKAEKNGFKGVVVTVDSPVIGRKLNDSRNKFTIPAGFSVPNYPEFSSNISFADFAQQILDPSATWEYFRWLKRITSLPLIAKGIYTGQDAIRAIYSGADAILVSNHGGRQLDGAPATIEALPEVVRAVRGMVDIYLDGGVRTGSDVIKAIAMGARAVFIGRPYLWGLSYCGSNGVRHTLEILRDELNRTMKLTGTSNIQETRSALVVRENYYDTLLDSNVELEVP